MARARNIKPGTMDNEVLAECDFAARLLFVYLWMLADRAGRLEDRPKRIRVQAFPYDEGVDAEPLLEQLHSRGFILRYSVGGCKYIQILKFKEHQTPHIKEKESQIPAPDKVGAEQVQGNDKHQQSTPGFSDSLNDDSLIPDSLNHESSAPPSRKKKRATPDGYSAEFEEAWRVYPKRPGANKKASFKAWSARIASGVEPQLMITGSARYAAYCAANNTDPQYIKQPATFFGPDHHYLSDWTPTNSTGKQQGNNGRKTIHEQRAATIAALTGWNNNGSQQQDAFSDARDITGDAQRLD